MLVNRYYEVINSKGVSISGRFLKASKALKELYDAGLGHKLVKYRWDRLAEDFLEEECITFSDCYGRYWFDLSGVDTDRIAQTIISSPSIIDYKIEDEIEYNYHIMIGLEGMLSFTPYKALADCTFRRTVDFTEWQDDSTFDRFHREFENFGNSDFMEMCSGLASLIKTFLSKTQSDSLEVLDYDT